MENINKMMDCVIQDIKKENVHISDIVAVIDEIDAKNNSIELYKEFIPRIIDYMDGNTLLSYIYDKKELNDYVMYLFYKKMIRLNEVTEYIYNYILNNTYWGLGFILKNIDEISESKMFSLVSFCETNNSLFKKFLNAFKNSKNKLTFLSYSIHYSSYKFDEEDIINTIYYEKTNNYEQLTFINKKENKKLLKSDISNQMMDKGIYIELFEKYGEELFEAEKTNKMAILYNLSDKYNYLKEKYKIGQLLYSRSYQSKRTDNAISSIINYGYYDKFCKELLEYFPDLNLRIISLKTQTSDVFASEKNVLKLGTPRFNNNIDLDFFRIIPTSITRVKNDDKEIDSVYEFQERIDTDESHITNEMIYELFLDFKKHGMFIHDPNCLAFKKENFGLLKSYKDANLGKYKNHEDLPESFKKHPLVLYDTDLVYKYSGSIKPPELPFSSSLTMDNAIESYNEAKKYIKKGFTFM